MNPKCPDALAFTGRGFQEKEITLFTHAHVYFFNVYLCIYIYFVFVYLISTFLQLLQELLFHSKRKDALPRSYLVSTQR